jgi:hypothetical protein
MVFIGLKNEEDESKSDLRCVSLHAREKIQICTYRFELSTELLQVFLDHRSFGGGGLGFGTPVVSYAPRPMLQEDISLVIMWDAEEMSM